LYEIINAPQGGCLDFDTYTWDIVVNDPSYRLRQASFHHSAAGCERTTHSPGGSFRVTDQGAFTSFEWNGGQACGRYQADIAIGKDGDYDTIVGVVINTGVNCERTPPEEPVCEINCGPPPPPPPPPGCRRNCDPPPPPPCVEDCEPPLQCEPVDAQNHSVKLANSGAATELAYVNQFGNFVAAGKTSDGPGTSDGDYAVVLVKAGRLTYVFFNVESGDSFLPLPHGISHVSRFICVPQELN
jgi:hypothetical protein